MFYVAQLACRVWSISFWFLAKSFPTTHSIRKDKKESYKVSFFPKLEFKQNKTKIHFVSSEHLSTRVVNLWLLDCRYAIVGLDSAP